MDDHYRAFFGLAKEPFGADIGYSEILKTPELENVEVRFDYVVRIGAIGIITGEVGSGKSTAVRYAQLFIHHRILGVHYGILPPTQRCARHLSFQQLQSRHDQND